MFITLPLIYVLDVLNCLNIYKYLIISLRWDFIQKYGSANEACGMLRL